MLVSIQVGSPRHLEEHGEMNTAGNEKNHKARVSSVDLLTASVGAERGLTLV